MRKVQLDTLNKVVANLSNKGWPEAQIKSHLLKKAYETVDVTPNWGQLYNYFKHMKDTDPKQFEKFIQTMTVPEWLKLVNVAGETDDLLAGTGLESQAVKKKAGFWRLPMQSAEVSGALHYIEKHITALFNQLRSGNDFDKENFDWIIAQLQRLGSLAKEFNSAEELTGEDSIYASKKKAAVLSDSVLDQLNDLFSITIRPAFTEDMGLTTPQQAKEAVDFLINKLQSINIDDIITVSEDED